MIYYMQGKFSFADVPVVVADWIPPNEILIVMPEQRVKITYHEGPFAGQSMYVTVRRQELTRVVNIEVP